MNTELFRLLLGGSPAGALTLGEATVMAKSAIRGVNIRQTWLLIGDPTMRLGR